MLYIIQVVLIFFMTKGLFIKQVGDDLERNRSLNELIGQIKVTPQTAFDTFANVAKQIFSDGVYNWGRVVTLLYFGFKLASSVASQVPLLKLVVDWVVRFVKEKLVNWIAEHGGWVSPEFNLKFATFSLLSGQFKT